MSRCAEILKLAVYRLLKQSEFLLFHLTKFLLFFLECRFYTLNRTLMIPNNELAYFIFIIPN